MRYISPYTALSKAIKRSRRDTRTRSRKVEERLIKNEVARLSKLLHPDLTDIAAREWVRMRVQKMLAR